MKFGSLRNLLLLFAAILTEPAWAHPPASTEAPRAPTTAGEWRSAAREDLEAAYAIFSTRHPGMFDPRNPAFPDRLRRARDVALAFGNKVLDAEGHMRALALFSAVLADGHAFAAASYSGSGALWPGFSTVWRGDSLKVLEPAQSGPPRGSVLLACDGVAAQELIRRSAFYFNGRPDEAGQWWVNAPGFFFRPPSVYETLPRQCSFRSPDGRTINYGLAWQPVPEKVFLAMLRAGERAPIGLSVPRPGLHLITLSSFNPDDQGRAAYVRLSAELEASARRMAAGRAVVIDLRGNGGGSSSWSEDVAARLWGNAAVQAAQAAYFWRTSIWWLAHPANEKHFRGAVQRFRAEGRSNVAAEIERVVTGISTAVARGNRFYVQHYGAQLARTAVPAKPRRLPPVYVITDGACASACLDAVDLFKRFPRVKLVGAPTSADSDYLEVLSERLPSGRGFLAIPTKIWVNRPRGSGEVYRPDIPVNDLEWTTAGMLDRVEQDLRPLHR